jgi:hypothetical protein
VGVQLVNAAQARQLAGRPKTDRLDARWLARLTMWSGAQMRSSSAVLPTRSLST